MVTKFLHTSILNLDSLLIYFEFYSVLLSVLFWYWKSYIMFYAIGLQNIVLIRDPEYPRKFYPRFNLEDTSSFQDLDDHRYLDNPRLVRAVY